MAEDDNLEILRNRLAKGEISVAEFNSLATRISGGGVADGIAGPSLGAQYPRQDGVYISTAIVEVANNLFGRPKGYIRWVRRFYNEGVYAGPVQFESDDLSSLYIGSHFGPKSAKDVRRYNPEDIHFSSDALWLPGEPHRFCAFDPKSV
ncbi:MAG: hypothetical protein KDE63_13450 [Novosphingobium sp.]|nr:hypothetical protein [Novosphingobium sp.]